MISRAGEQLWEVACEAEPVIHVEFAASSTGAALEQVHLQAPSSDDTTVQLEICCC
jgi:hypothetical protein